MDATGKQCVGRERLHRPLMVRPELTLIDISSNRNRALQGIEFLLRLFAADAFQPSDCLGLMWRILGESETVGHDDESAAGARMRDPTEINVIFKLSFGEFAVRPVSHRRKRTTAFLNRFDGLVPGQRRMIRILVFQNFGVALRCLFYFWIVEGHLTAKQILPTGWSYRSEECILEKLSSSPNAGVTDRKWYNSCGFKLGAVSQEFVDRNGVADLDAGLI